MSDLTLVNTPEWAIVIKGIIRAEMARYGVSYAELSNQLQNEFNITQTESNLKAKVNKGILGAQLFVQILIVLGAESLNLNDTKQHYQKVKE